MLTRDLEFKFLKSKNKKIICLFCVDDIRSLKLTINYWKNKNLDCGQNYYDEKFDPDYDNLKKKIALSADRYADLIFSSPIANMSYLKSKQYPFRLQCDEIFFKQNDKKFENKIPKILHAPSSSLNKGTPIVRATITKLQQEGYIFEYVELQNVTNDIVIENLKSAHISLNQFYNPSIGLFGIESMASNCAVLMSADSSLQPNIPDGSSNAWLFTRYWEIYDNLKFLLDNPEKIKFYAQNGYNFAKKHYTRQAVKDHINKILIENNLIN